jgi:hypothetical protein
MNDKKILEFDILRSLAIFSLFLHHGGIYNFSIFGFPLSSLDPYLEFFLLGSFTFMAGYLLIGSFNITHEKFLLSIWASKIIRIYIPYILALLLLAIFFDIEATRLDLVIHVFGAQLLMAPRIGVPIMTIWFVGLLLVYYLIFPILLKFIDNIPGLLFSTLLIFFGAYIIHTRWGFIEYRFFYYYFVFVAGMLSALTGCLRRIATTKYYLLDKLLLILLGIYGLSLFNDEPLFSINPEYILVITFYILATVIFIFSVAQTLIKGKEKLTIFGNVAYASYFAFLFHRPIWKLILIPFTIQSDLMWFLYIIIIGSAVVISVSFYFQKFYNSIIDIYIAYAVRVIRIFEGS